MWADFDVRGQQRMDLFTGGTIIMDYRLIFWTGLHVEYCDVFISCLDSHSDGTHSLQMIHCWASDVVQNFSKSGLTKKQTHLHLGWPESEYIFMFGWTTHLIINKRDLIIKCYDYTFGKTEFSYLFATRSINIHIITPKYRSVSSTGLQRWWNTHTEFLFPFPAAYFPQPLLNHWLKQRCLNSKGVITTREMGHE